MSVIRYSIHGVVDVLVDSSVAATVMENIDFQIGYFKTSEEACTAPHQILLKPYGEFRFDPADRVDTFHLMRGVKARCVDIPGEKVAVEKRNGAYTIYADRPKFLINLFIQFLFVEHRISLVHAAAISDDQSRVILLPGAGGVGKTAILGHMVQHHSYRLLGDDIIGLTVEGQAFSFPRSFVLKEYHRSVYPEIFHQLRLVDKEGDKPYLAAVSVKEIFGWDSVQDRGVIKNILFLQRYDGAEFRVESIDEDTLCQRMFAIIHHEWVDIMRQFFTLGAMELVNILGYFCRVGEIVRAGVSGKKSEILLIPDGATPIELAQAFVSWVETA